ncbi:MAG: hypothetical protein Q8P12_03005, partial [bacterium]|nr:hypothetical protein [bacterium]
EGAESYLIRGEIDFSTGFWGSLFNFISCPSCWFVNLAVDFVIERLGLSGEAIGCPAALWDENVLDEDEIPCVDVTVNKNIQTGILATEHADTACTFTKETKYRWHIATCLGPGAQHCGPFSDKESFTTNSTYNGVPGFIIPAPEPVEPLYDPSKPEEIPIAGFRDRLAWDTPGEGANCGHFHRVTITRESNGAVIRALDMGSFALDFPLEELSDPQKNSKQEQLWEGLDEVYSWNAEPCFIRDKENIDCEGTLSETWRFRTAGASPANLQTNVSEAVAVSWDASPKAASYRYRVAEDDGFSAVVGEFVAQEASAVLSWPTLLPETTYWWQVAACVDTQGTICGERTDPVQFTTLPLTPPAAPENPEDGGQLFLPGSVSWQPSLGASFYQYQIAYSSLAPDETLEECSAKQGTQIIPEPGDAPPITDQTSFFLNERCTGTYQWQVRACADSECTLATDWSESALWTFTGQDLPAEGFGLVPCGRDSNNPDTPYNEKEACQTKHVGFLLQNILDFVLWRLSLIVLAAFAVFVAVFTYFSMGTPETLARIRLVFRSFLFGFLLMILAWAIVNIVMALLGFQVALFGRWWELPF